MYAGKGGEPVGAGTRKTGRSGVPSFKIQGSSRTPASNLKLETSNSSQARRSLAPPAFRGLFRAHAQFVCLPGINAGGIGFPDSLHRGGRDCGRTVAKFPPDVGEDVGDLLVGEPGHAGHGDGVRPTIVGTGDRHRAGEAVEDDADESVGVAADPFASGEGWVDARQAFAFGLVAG